MTQTQIDATNWINNVVKERGIKATRQLLYYNVTKNQYFNQSIHWITQAWARLNELDPS